MKLKKLAIMFLTLFSVSMASCSSPNIENKPKEDEESEYKYNYYDDGDPFTAGAVKLSFNSAGNYDYLKGIDGKKVALKGFMFSASPVDGSFIFLSNMPYQSCPFCALNTDELSNCFEIYPKKNSKFTVVETAVCIVGTLKVAPSKDQLFSDKFGYEFLSKIEDGEVKAIENIQEEGNFALRNAFASTSLLTDIYDMLNYVYFTCKWPEFFVNEWEDVDGVIHPGFYLYADDAETFIFTDGAQYNYGYVDGYFDSFITRIKEISETGFEELVNIIKDCKSTAEYAINELKAEHYTYKYQYVERFDREDYIFTLNDASLASKPDELYNRFSYWLTSFEM